MILNINEKTHSFVPDNDISFLSLLRSRISGKLSFKNLPVVLILTISVSVFHLNIPVTHAGQSGDVIVAGMPASFPPYYMIDENSGEPAGFGVEVIERLADENGLKVEYRIYKTWPEVHKALREGSIDIIPNMGITAERTLFADFTMPMETLQIRIYVRNTNLDIRDIGDLAGHDVAVVKVNKGRFIMEEMGTGRLQVYVSFERALLALLSGKADALIFPDTVTNYFLRDLGLEAKVKAVGRPLLEVKRAVGVRKDLPGLHKILDAGVRDFVLTPEYREIYTRWHTVPVSYWNVQRVSILMGTALLVIFILLLMWRYVSVMRLNRALEDAVRESNIVKNELHNEIVEHEKDKDKLRLRTEELSRKFNEVEKLNRIFVGREIRMNELKREIENLKRNSV